MTLNDLTIEDCAHILASLTGAEAMCRKAALVRDDAAQTASDIARLIAKIKDQTGLTQPANKVPA